MVSIVRRDAAAVVKKTSTATVWRIRNDPRTQIQANLVPELDV